MPNLKAKFVIVLEILEDLGEDEFWKVPAVPAVRCDLGRSSTHEESSCLEGRQGKLSGSVAEDLWIESF